MADYEKELAEKKRIDDESKALARDGERPVLAPRKSSAHVENGVLVDGDDDDSSLGKGQISERQLSWQRAAVLL